MDIHFSDLKQITGGRMLQNPADTPVWHLITDSRKPVTDSKALFVAIRGNNHDGHHFIKDLYNQGIRMFLVEDPDFPVHEFTQASFLLCTSSMQAIQNIAAYKRTKFTGSVVGITGSNGKTIVKEWLFRLLNQDYPVYRSPKSFNSQLGVPLSVWLIDPDAAYALIEAGISKPDEMEKLRHIIRPRHGIFTNLGAAHDEGFRSRQHKASEKAVLFQDAELIVFNRDYPEIEQVLEDKYSKSAALWGWSRTGKGNIPVSWITEKGKSKIFVSCQGKDYHLQLSFTDQASLENLTHVLVYLISQNVDPADLQPQLERLERLNMRLELLQGANDTYLIDDSYSNDLDSLRIALDFLRNQQQKERKSLVLSDFAATGAGEENIYRQLARLLESYPLYRLVAVGTRLPVYAKWLNIPCHFFPDTGTLIRSLPELDFRNEIVLIKGARKFRLERLVKQLQQKIHSTMLEINLDAFSHNLNFYRQRLKPGTKIMVMVKGYAYGSGIIEIANLLQFHRVDYLAVAYTDEGIYLRENGIRIPIMVMNPAAESFEKMIRYQLEPEIYSLRQLELWLQQHQNSSNPIGFHLKVDTGMHRLGFGSEDLPRLIQVLHNNPGFYPVSVFSHLAGADEQRHDDFTHRQASDFVRFFNELKESLPVQPVRHLLNSAGILRFPEYQFDMVRLGIGLYGVESAGIFQDHLQPVSILKTVISQVRKVAGGETIGYSRKGIAGSEKMIGTIAIGYADGFFRAFGNGVASVYVNGRFAPVIGNVCMDMTMIDLTGIPAEEGDEVEIFGPNLSIQDLATAIGTIPYEILTSVGERVKRIYFTE